MQTNGTVTYAGIVFEWEGDYDRHAREFDDFAIMVNGEDIDAQDLYVRETISMSQVKFVRLDERIMSEALVNAEAEAFDAAVDAAMDARDE
jgi:hypothetical protein